MHSVLSEPSRRLSTQLEVDWFGTMAHRNDGKRLCERPACLPRFLATRKVLRRRSRQQLICEFPRFGIGSPHAFSLWNRPAPKGWIGRLVWPVVTRSATALPTIGPS